MAPSERARQVPTAARTDPAAAHRLAGWCRGGEEGLHQSLESAFRWELRAAERGHVEAQYDTACASHAGRGVEVDYVAAAKWFGKAAEQGHRDYPFNLGVALAQGTGTRRLPQNSSWRLRGTEGGRPRRVGCYGEPRLALQRKNRRGAGPRTREHTGGARRTRTRRAATRRR